MKRAKRCMVQDCFAVAPYASPQNPAVHACEEHKKRHFVNMRNKRCLAPGCYRNPHYGVSRAVDPNSKAQFCTLHKAPGMENVNGGRCAGPDCSKQPRFAMAGNKGKFCSKHREEGMVDVLYTPCASPGCMKHPHFGHRDGGPRYCAQHRAEDMVDVKHRRCAVKGCRKDRVQIPGPRKRSNFCDVHHTEEEQELFCASDLAGAGAEQSPREPRPVKRAAASSEYVGDRDKRGRMSDMEWEDVRCLSMPPEESGFSQPPDARIWMPAATPPASTRQARFPEFAETACTHPKAAWIEGAAPSKLIPRLEGAPYAPCYSETLPPTLSAQTPTIVAHFTIARARIPPVYPSEQSTYRSSGQRLAPLEPSDANPYPLFYRGGGCRGGGVSNATGSRSSWSTGTRVSSCQPKPIAQEAAGLRPFRLHPWQPSAARAVDQGWYPSPWEVYGDQLRSGFLEDYTSRTGGVGSGSLRESTSRPSAVT